MSDARFDHSTTTTCGYCGVGCRLEAHVRPSVDWRPNRFVWLGTTFPYPAFTFYFKENDDGHRT